MNKARIMAEWPRFGMFEKMKKTTNETNFVPRLQLLPNEMFMVLRCGV